MKKIEKTLSKLIGLLVYAIISGLLLVMGVIHIVSYGTVVFGMTGGALGALVGLFLSLSPKVNKRLTWLLIGFLVCALLFVGAQVVLVPKGSYAVLETGSKTQVLTPLSVRFVAPIQQRKVSYISDEITLTDLAEFNSDGKEVKWDAKLKLQRSATYQGVFHHIRIFGNKDAWREKVERTFEKVLEERISNFSSEQELPNRFQFSLSSKSKDEFVKLGYTPEGPVQLRNIRIVQDAK